MAARARVRHFTCMNIRTLMLLGLLVSAAAGAATREEREFARAMAATPDVAHGATLFAHCTGCHGADGGGMTNGSVPRIAGQHRSVLIRQLVQFRGGKHWDMRMEGVANNAEILKRPEDIADVAAHASGLIAPAGNGVGDGTNLERGAAIYQAECASCHGRAGEGDGKKETPRLAGQHAAYLARQIYDAVDARRPALSASHRKRLAPLTFEDVRGLTDYLSRLRAE
jgi:cytochrome c553